MASFDRLIRFETQEGKTLYGNLEKEVPTREIEGSSVEVLEGDVKRGRAKVGKVCLHFQFGSVRWERDV
jgi:transcription initiation factor TFIIH subunit 2